MARSHMAFLRNRLVVAAVMAAPQPHRRVLREQQHHQQAARNRKQVLVKRLEPQPTHLQLAVQHPSRAAMVQQAMALRLELVSVVSVPPVAARVMSRSPLVR